LDIDPRYVTGLVNYAAFLENELGDLSPGKWADFVVYEENFLQIPSKNLPQMNPTSLFISGQKVK
jgi:predicted amidohydrolase YtcJ